MKKLLISILVLILSINSGCDMFKRTSKTPIIDLKTKQDIQNASKKIDENSKIIQEQSNSISKESQKIYADATEIQGKTPEENKVIISPYVENIKESSQSITNSTKEIDRANIDLGTAKELLKTAEQKINSTNKTMQNIVKERNELENKLKDSEEKRNSQLHKMLQWLIIGSIVAVAAFAVLFFLHNSKAGLTGASVSGLVLIIAVFVEKYMIWIAIGGGILVVGLIGILIYNVYIKNKAFSEVVNTVEITQDELSPEIKNKIFGEGKSTGLMKNIQSKTTMNLVKKEKAKMSTLWNYAKNKKGNL